VKVGSERLVLRDIDAKLTAQAAAALNEAFDTDLFEGGLLIGEATVLAHIGNDNNDNNHHRDGNNDEDSNGGGGNHDDD
jgi:hypothetical protein